MANITWTFDTDESIFGLALLLCARKHFGSGENMIRIKVPCAGSSFLV